MYGLIGWHA